MVEEPPVRYPLPVETVTRPCAGGDGEGSRRVA